MAALGGGKAGQPTGQEGGPQRAAALQDAAALGRQHDPGHPTVVVVDPAGDQTGFFQADHDLVMLGGRTFSEAASSPSVGLPSAPPWPGPTPVPGPRRALLPQPRDSRMTASRSRAASSSSSGRRPGGGKGVDGAGGRGHALGLSYLR